MTEQPEQPGPNHNLSVEEIIEHLIEAYPDDKFHVDDVRTIALAVAQRALSLTLETTQQMDSLQAANDFIGWRLISLTSGIVRGVNSIYEREKQEVDEAIKGLEKLFKE